MDDDEWEAREIEREIETLNPTPVDPGQPRIEGERHEAGLDLLETK